MVLNPSAEPRPFCVALSPSVHWRARFFYCCTLYIFFFLDFVSGDLALTGFLLLTWTSNFHCFGTLGVLPGARTHGRDYSDCRASVLKLKSAWPLFFLELSKMLETMAYGEGFPTLTHRTVQKVYSACKESIYRSLHITVEAYSVFSSSGVWSSLQNTTRNIQDDFDVTKSRV